jgi:hypothetical protein
MPIEAEPCPEPGCGRVADADVKYTYDSGGNVVARLVQRIIRCRRPGCRRYRPA